MALVLLEKCAAAFLDTDAHCPHPSLQGSGTDSIPVEGTPELPCGHAAAAACSSTQNPEQVARLSEVLSSQKLLLSTVAAEG